MPRDFTFNIRSLTLLSACAMGLIASLMGCGIPPIYPPINQPASYIPVAAPLFAPMPNFSPIAPSTTSNPSGVTMAAPAEAMNSPLPILPNGNSWLSLSSSDQRAVTNALATDRGFSGLVSRLSVRQQNILVDDVHRASQSWTHSRLSPHSDLPEAYRATLVSRSGVVRVLPRTQWQLYSEMRSDPESLRGQALRYAANETLYTEYRSYPVAVSLSDENRAQLQGAITELHLLNLVLDHTHLSDQRDIVTVLNYGTTARDQINAFIEGVRSRSVEELRGLAVAAVAAALPAPAAVVLGTAALYHVSNSILSGELQTAVVGFKDRITGVDPVERARALGEATTAVVSALTGLRVAEMGAVLATRIGVRMNIAVAGAELAVLRETAQTVLDDLRREVQLPLREISDNVPYNMAHLRSAIELLRGNDIALIDRRNIIEAFGHDTRVTRTTEDRIVYRYFSDNNPRGRWVTPKPVTNPRVDLALPTPGPYRVQTWTLPAGTDVLEGLVAPNFGMAGGAQQIFVPNTEVLR